MNEDVKAYFDFTKKERIGIFVVLAVIGIIAILPQLYSKTFATSNPPKFDSSIVALSLKENDTSFSSFKKYDDENNNLPKYKFDKENLEASLFKFDPNTIDEATWQELGTKAKTAASIQKYISKGGKFRHAVDILKVWGMSDALKQRLIAFVEIAPQENKYPTKIYTPTERTPYVKKEKEPIDINVADSAAFESLPGIGGGFARRIISFRNKLGGFYKIEQVAETFGLPDSTYQKAKPFLLCNANGFTKININKTTADELKNHPYFRWQLANIIINYRTQHGDYKSVEDLKKIMTIDAETYNKISPYLTL